MAAVIPSLRALMHHPTIATHNLADNLKILKDGYPNDLISETIEHQVHEISDKILNWTNQLEPFKFNDEVVDSVESYAEALKNLNTYCKKLIQIFANNKMSKGVAELYWEYFINTYLFFEEITADIAPPIEN